MSVRYTPVLSWLRLMQNWFDNPRLARACDVAGPVAAAGWLVLVARSLNSGGRFDDADDVARALRVSDIGLDRDVAAMLGPVLIRAGLLLPAGQGFIIANLDSFIPRDNALAPQERAGARELRALSPESSPGVTEGVRESFTKSGSESRVALGNRGVIFRTDENGDDYAVLPPQSLATDEHCSHGFPWELRPAGVSKAGVPYPAYWSGNHQLADGQWCKDRPRSKS
jgi:hypothetical protein